MKQDLFERLQWSMHDVSYKNSDLTRNIIQFSEYQYDLKILKISPLRVLIIYYLLNHGFYQTFETI